VWEQHDASGDAVFAARRAPDGRWIDPGRAPARLSSPGATAYGATLAVGPDGGAIAAWAEGTRIAARRTGADRASWEALEWLSPEHAADVGPPVAAMGPHDRAVVGWPQGSAKDARIVFARVE
jgi:hypothetical protein